MRVVGVPVCWDGVVYDVRSTARSATLHRRVGLVGFVSALVALALIVVPSAHASTATSTRKPRLLVIGDSIILGTGDRIAQDLPAWDVTFDAKESRSTAVGLDVLRAHGTDFTTVVVELGANDSGTPSVFTPRVDALLAALRGVHRVLWLTIPEARPYYRQANAIIRTATGRYPNASVADWSGAIQPGDVVDDGLHLTPKGYADMAAWVAKVVASPQAPTTTTTTTTTTQPARPTNRSTSASAATTRPVTGASGGLTAGSKQHDGRTTAWILGVAAMGAIVVVVVSVLRRRRRT